VRPERRPDHRGVFGGIRAIGLDVPIKSFVDRREPPQTLRAGIVFRVPRDQLTAVDQVLDEAEEMASFLDDLFAIQAEVLDRGLAPRASIDRTNILLVELEERRRVIKLGMDEQWLLPFDVVVVRCCPPGFVGEREVVALESLVADRAA
jgi:hypothetical protein